MAPRQSTVTRKGQITVPADIRRALSLNEGDKVTFEVEDDRVSIVRSGSVVARTAGAIKSDMPPLTAEELREAGEQAIAEAALERSGD